MNGADVPFACPRRTEEFGPWDHSAAIDTWREDRTCSFCGSLAPETFMRLAGEGTDLTPTDKNYKVYVGQRQKFYFQHLAEDQHRAFVDLLNAKKLNIGYPGHFYVLPFFVKRK